MAGSYRKRGNKYYLEYMFKGKRYNSTIECDEKNVDYELQKFVINVKENYKLMQIKRYHFETFAQEWLNEYVRKNLRPRTIDFYKHLLNSRIIPHFYGYKISDISRSDIKIFLNTLTEDLTSETIKKYRNCLVTMFNYAIEMEYLQINPAQNVSIPKGKIIEKKDNCYNVEQLKQLLKSLDNERPECRIFVYIVAFTGIRREECLPLKIDDIDFENNLININKALTMSDEKGLIIESTKNKSSIRRIKIPNVLSTEMKKYIKEQNIEDSLFKLTPNAITQWFGKFVKRHKLEHITLHGLRHTYATYLISQNKDINIISTLLGHSSVNITGKIYINKDYTNEQDAVNTLDKILT